VGVARLPRLAYRSLIVVRICRQHELERITFAAVDFGEMAIAAAK
jgi:hypothetical protein